MFLDVGSDGLGPTFSGVSPTTSNSTSFSRSSLQKNTYAFKQPGENQNLSFSQSMYSSIRAPCNYNKMRKTY